VRHVAPLAVGINCSLGAALMRPYIEEMARVADTFVSCYPNAGLPNPMSATGYDETPRETARLLEDFARSGFRQSRRRLLRHDAGAHPGDRGIGAECIAARRFRRPRKPRRLRRPEADRFRLPPFAAEAGRGDHAAAIPRLRTVASRQPERATLLSP